MAALLGLGWLVWNNYHEHKTTHKKDFKLQELNGIIIYILKLLLGLLGLLQEYGFG